MLKIFDARPSATEPKKDIERADRRHPGLLSGLPVLGTLEPRLYSRDVDDESSPATLAIALASVDAHFLMSPRAIAMADTAAARGFNVVVHSLQEPMAPDRPANEIGSGKLTHMTEMPTPELLAGLLWRRYVPVVNNLFPRVGSRDRWAVVRGFDGISFQVFDPERPRQDDLAVTIAEMRVALGAKEAVCLVVAPRCV